MKAWHVSGAVLFLLAAVPAGWGQTCTLAEMVKSGDCFRYQLDMQLNGEIRVRKDNKLVPVKLAASASHAYPERVLAVSGDTVQKSVRLYETARASIQRGENKAASTLRASRTFVVAQRFKGQHLVYSPAGALYPTEIELLAEHFDTLPVTGVLPGKAVKVGETWKLANPVAQALCSLEGMTENKLTGKLDKVAGDLATFSISGSAAGVENGAVVKMTVEALGEFDLKAKRLTRLRWKQKDERDQGPVSPASTVETTVLMARKAIDQPKGLDDVALVKVPDGFEPPAAMTHVEFRDAKGRYALVHTRDWQLTAVTEDHAILRLMDRGDFVAQVSITPWDKAKPGEHLTPEQFKEAMAGTSGWRPEKELQAEVVPATEKGRWVYRLSVQGQLDGVAVLQNFFLVAAPTGEQVVLTFTMSPKQADKLGARDLSVAASIEVPAAPEKK
jgi:hypothetical protein